MRKKELYTQPYDTIDWPAQRNNVSKADLHSPHKNLFDLIAVILGAYEQCSIPPLRNAGVEYAYKLIVYEDENTGYQTLGPVSKMMNLVARFHAEGFERDAYRRPEKNTRYSLCLALELILL